MPSATGAINSFRFGPWVTPPFSTVAMSRLTPVNNSTDKAVPAIPPTYCFLYVAPGHAMNAQSAVSHTSVYHAVSDGRLNSSWRDTVAQVR